MRASAGVEIGIGRGISSPRSATISYLEVLGGSAHGGVGVLPAEYRSGFTATRSGNAFNKSVQSLYTGEQNFDCIFRYLAGSFSGGPCLCEQPWFALAPSHPRFKETYALLFSARLSGETIFVATTGAAVSGCGGHAEVRYAEFS